MADTVTVYHKGFSKMNISHYQDNRRV